MNYDKLSDSELTDLVATRVMGWVKHIHDDGTWCFAIQHKGCTPDCLRFGWQPLINWNATMEVVNVFRNKLFSERRAFRKEWEKVSGAHMSEALTHLDQREICIAALQAND